MRFPPDITLILPAYNEAARIAETLQQSTEYFRSRNLEYQIIVAADGDDGTREIVREIGRRDPRIQVIGSRGRLGKGRGVREAVKLAEGVVVGYADADNKVPISEFDKIAKHLKAGCQVVIGSRALGGSKIERKQPLYRQLGSRGFAFCMQTIVGLSGVHDTQCGFKFFPLDVAQFIFSNQQIDGYMFDVEILAIALRLGYRITEVPIRWRDDGDSRLDLVSGNIRNLRDLFRIRMALASRGFSSNLEKSELAKS
ncbi:MAG TPA: dolichyl-phosphate beta-glucosyltransferase [Bryobacteraceae bacterium]|nr:dolichyl-phosphate beta-glucosyltransferase [Bryobacteraceae bacterium]